MTNYYSHIPLHERAITILESRSKAIQWLEAARKDVADYDGWHWSVPIKLMNSKMELQMKVVKLERYLGFIDRAYLKVSSEICSVISGGCDAELQGAINRSLWRVFEPEDVISG